MAEPETGKLHVDAEPGAGWAEAAFDALDMAAAVFGEDMHLRTVNSCWRRKFESTPIADSRLADVMEAIAAKDHEHPIEGFEGRDLVGLVRSFVRDYDLPRRGADPVLLTSTPMPDGGYLVTLRGPDRGRMVETRALELLRDSIESVDMGMMFWDSGLIVRMTNEAWARHVAPARVGETMHAVCNGILQSAAFEPRRGLSAEQTLISIVMESHRHKRRWELRPQNGRIIRISTFPTRSGGVLAVAFDVTDRQDIEAQARNLMSDAINSLGDGVLLLDGHLNSLMFNRSFAAMFHGSENALPVGAPAGELIRASIDLGLTAVPGEMSPKTFLAKFRDSILECAQDVEMHLAAGRIVQHTAYATAMGGYVVVFRDVSARVGAEAALREAEARTRMIVESLGEGIALLDPEMRLRMTNPAFRRLVFADHEPSGPGAMLADEIRAAISSGNLDVPPEDVEATLTRLIDCVRDQRGDVELPASGDRTLEASGFGTPEGGRLVLVRDVTGRRAAECAQREADELVRTIVDASPTTFLVSRLADGKVVYAPPLSRERFGNIVTTLSFFLDPSDRERYIEALLKTGSLTDYPVRFRRSDGSIMDGLTSARVIHFRGEQLIVSATRDITEQLAMQAELERQRELAHQNEKLTALGGLLAGVAHELNNPLSIIVANAMMLEEDVRDPALRRRVERLATAAKRSGRIVKTFLSMARNRPMRTNRVAINEIVDEAVEIMSYGLRSIGVEIALDLDSGDPVVDVDTDQIIQVLTNLLLNAEHALRDIGSGGRLTIATLSHGAEVEIRVRDNGPGVPEDLQGRIFEPYFTTKEVGEGTGVGLAFCHRLVTAHGGRIFVREPDGGGAEFCVVLPCVPAEVAKASEKGQPSQDGKGHVLVVDDEPDVAETVSEALNRGGFRTTVTASAAGALAECATTRFDAILSDVKMPGMSGVAFYEELRRTNPSQAARVGFLTGDAIGRLLETGVNDTGRPHLEKPAEPKEILDLVLQLGKDGAGGS